MSHVLRPLRLGWLWLFVVLATAGGAARADDTDSSTAQEATVKAEAEGSSSSSASSSGSSSASTPASKYPPHATVLKDFKPVDGLIKLYRKDNRLYAELMPSQFNRDMIVLTSIARGIGEGALLGGMTWGFGDDWLWQFRRVDDNVHIVRRNVRFRATKGTPEERAVELAYTDSVLFSLPVVTTGPGGGVIVDFGQVFMSDLPQIQQALPGFAFSASKSTWAAVKGYKDNIELTVAATYASSGMARIDSVPDSRGVSINVHYSISLLPNTGYRPRLADDRVGYFLTVIKDYSKKADEDRFVRYINRWDLQKADSSSDVSPPKQPIVFWIEKTVPFKYRKPIGDGILEWNKAFEKAGFVNAIEVRQQPGNAEWDPEDINYNTFRWITAGAGFAMGPSRVNPTNGQILDADIIFDADFVQFWKQEYETMTPASVAALCGGPLELKEYLEEMNRLPAAHRHSHLCRCDMMHGMSREMAFGMTALMDRAGSVDHAVEMEKMIMQGLKEVAMHEVGHTLGLRHNFKASTMLSLDEMHDMEKTSKVGLTASVMDYNPTNIAPKGVKQGDYFSTTIGPYDMWAIEYGYKSVSGGSTDGELPELKKIAQRGAQPNLAYSTDEDTRAFDPDPLSNRFDLGSDPLEFARYRADLVGELWPGLVERVTKEGEGFQRARQAFGILLSQYGMASIIASRHVGGLYTHRDHRGDPDGRSPFEVVPAEKQREALTLVEKQLLSDKPFDFPPELLNSLAATRWNHWGMPFPSRPDLAIHDVIALFQDRAMDQMLSSTTLTRLHDSELRVPADEDAFTTAELIKSLTATIFAEVNSLKPGEYTERKPAISSLRRNLQRNYLRRLSNIALGNSGAPSDCQTVAYAELARLKSNIDATLKGTTRDKKGKLELDTYSQAHLMETSERIAKVLDARLILSRP